MSIYFTYTKDELDIEPMSVAEINWFINDHTRDVFWSQVFTLYGIKEVA